MKKVINVFRKVVILGHPNALFATIMNFLGVSLEKIKPGNIFFHCNIFSFLYILLVFPASTVGLTHLNTVFAKMSSWTALTRHIGMETSF